MMSPRTGTKVVANLVDVSVVELSQRPFGQLYRPGMSTVYFAPTAKSKNGD